MNSYATLIFCFQLCLIQNAFSQCLGPGIPGYGYPNPAGPGYPNPVGPGYPGVLEPALGPGLGAPLGLEPLGLGTYGGAGVGEVNVIGELPVSGSTVIAGQVPILGAVEFNGLIPAGGIISVTGTCACGCGFNGPIVY